MKYPNDDTVMQAARELGAERGLDAGAVCALSNDGCPVADLSGEWADTPLPAEVYADIVARATHGSVIVIDVSAMIDADPELFHDAVTAFCDAYDETARDAYDDALHGR